jgi:hypothetical protein
MAAHYGEVKIKFEARGSKSETNSNDQNSNVLNKSRAKTLSQLVILVLVLALSLCACAARTASSRFYVLSPLLHTKLAGAEGATIGVLPVSLPDYLDRPQIVTRLSENQIKLDEFSRWAEPLEDNFYRILVENLSSLLSADRIIKTGLRSGVPVALQVRVEVVQFDGALDGDAILIVNWNLFGEGGKKPLLAKRSSFKEPTGAATYEALVAAQSKTVAYLSREIAEAIRDRN